MSGPKSSRAKLRIVVYGAGAIGSYFGGRLAHAGVDVHVIARGRQLEALQKAPLHVDSVNGQFEVTLPATSEPVEIGACDAVLLCVKSYDTEQVAATLKPMLAPGAAVISLQNGIDNEEKLADVVGREHVVGGAAYVLATLVAPGRVVHSGGPGSIVLGELNGSLTERVQTLTALFESAGIPAEATTEIQTRLWAKFAFICAQAGMTTCSGLPIGTLRSSEPAWAMFRALVEEVAALAAAEGTALGTEAVDEIIEFANGLAPDSTSSLYNDFREERRNELEALHGLVVRRSHSYGLQAPMHEAIYALLAARSAATQGPP